MKELVIGLGAAALALLALLAPALAGEAAPGKTAPQAAAAGTPSAGQGDGDGRLSDPELLDCLREEAAKLGVPHMQTYSDFSMLLQLHTDNAQSATLQRRAIFAIAEQMAPTKENCLKVILRPEDWRRQRFDADEERPPEQAAATQAWAPWRAFDLAARMAPAKEGREKAAQEPEGWAWRRDEDDAHARERLRETQAWAARRGFDLAAQMAQESRLEAAQALEAWTWWRFDADEGVPLERLRKTEHWAPWRGFNDLRREHAFDVLIGDGMLTPADLPALKESLQSARHCRSMVAAIRAIATLDRGEGRKMAGLLLGSDNCPLRAKVALMWALSKRGKEFAILDCVDFIDLCDESIVEALRDGEPSRCYAIRELLSGLARKAAADGDKGRQEMVAEKVGAMFDKAEENAKQALENIAKARAEFERTLAGEGARTNAAPKPQENRAQGKPQGETPKEPQNE